MKSRSVTLSHAVDRAGALLWAAARLPSRLHRDQQGTISIASVFTLLFLAMLMGQVMNSGLAFDNKVRQQCAADAATYSGGVAMARQLNTLAFTNHLLSDVFALTAYMREARDQSSASLTDEILQAWLTVAPVFQESSIPKMQNLGNAIVEKVPAEKELIRTWSEWAAAVSEITLPILEQILEDRAIPEFQRAVVEYGPLAIQQSTNSVAERHAQGSSGTNARRGYNGVLWRTSVETVGGSGEQSRPTIPAVDPLEDSSYMDRARLFRQYLARIYLDGWNSQSHGIFSTYEKNSRVWGGVADDFRSDYPIGGIGRMSQFHNLWRGFTHAQLERLLDEEYPDDNMPHLLRRPPSTPNYAQYLEQDFMFVGVVYGRPFDRIMPGLFTDPMDVDQQAYAQTVVFIPQNRWVQWWQLDEFGIPFWSLVRQSQENDTIDIEDPREFGWDLFNQNWTAQLTPARTRDLAAILQTQPDVSTFNAGAMRLPQLNGLSTADLNQLSNH